jgi:REP element-mobilizing transposase RayT
MVRTPRDWCPGATYHVTARGNRKQDLFHDIEDRKKYLSYLQETKDKYPFTIHAYCLMSNHIHLLIETMTFHSSRSSESFIPVMRFISIKNMIMSDMFFKEDMAQPRLIPLPIS